MKSRKMVKTTIIINGVEVEANVPESMMEEEE